MLPPVLEIYVLWHPDDVEGMGIAQNIVQHFHGTLFSGLIGGAVEVYVRNIGWKSLKDAPRPIPLIHEPLPSGIRPPRFVAVVPILGIGFARELEIGNAAWQSYVDAIVSAGINSQKECGIFPFVIDSRSIANTRLATALGRFQAIAASPLQNESLPAVLGRELSQGIAQMLTGAGRLTIFISHTKRHSSGEEDVSALVSLVRDIIRDTRLNEFFDASDLQPGEIWDGRLRHMAMTSALLAVRTDLYASREWCQREMSVAKREGMPVVIVDALGSGEERGSFLMDHVPRVPAKYGGGRWEENGVRRALNLLVDECLKRALWGSQAELAKEELGLSVAWWAPHAPEPITLTKWLDQAIQDPKFRASKGDILIIHPDPPLGDEEKLLLQELLSISGIDRKLDVLTPRLLAARGA